MNDGHTCTSYFCFLISHFEYKFEITCIHSINYNHFILNGKNVEGLTCKIKSNIATRVCKFIVCGILVPTLHMSSHGQLISS